MCEWRLWERGEWGILKLKSCQDEDFFVRKFFVVKSTDHLAASYKGSTFQAHFASAATQQWSTLTKNNVINANVHHTQCLFEHHKNWWALQPQQSWLYLWICVEHRLFVNRKMVRGRARDQGEMHLDKGLQFHRYIVCSSLYLGELYCRWKIGGDRCTKLGTRVIPLDQRLRKWSRTRDERIRWR